MKSVTSFTRQPFALAFIAGALIVSSPLLAADNDKSKKTDHNEQTETRHSPDHTNFKNEHKTLVGNYFKEEKLLGRCPPGLAKKNNGCNPPGQVKRWQMGQHLQHDVEYRALPADLLSLLGNPQTGYHYGMIDSDILLLMDGTEMVMDAIYNLGQ